MLGYLVWFILMQADNVSQFRPPQFWPPSQITCNAPVPPNYSSKNSLLDNSVNPRKLWVYDENKQGQWCVIDITTAVAKLVPGWYESSVITLMPSRQVPNIIPGRSTSEVFQKK